MMSGAMGLLACPSTQGPPKTESDSNTNSDAKPLSAVSPSTTACTADKTWLNSSTLPTEVAGDQTTCNFEQFMWQSMLALVQPSSANTNVLQFETWMPSYGVFVKSGAPTAWGQEPPNPCTTGPASTTAGGKPIRFYSDIILQAGADAPLMDLKREYVYYGMSVNKGAYDMLTGCQLYMANCAGPLKPKNPGIDIIGKYPNLAFPNNAVELKTSWMVLDDAAVASKLYYVVPGMTQHKGGACKPVNLGLTGIHIVSKTPTNQALIWATFEHRNNAPDCSNTSAKPPLGGAWNFYDPSCKDCPTNTYKAGAPGQICRMHPQGNSSVGTFPGGNDCKHDPNQLACQKKTVDMLAESSAAIVSINQSVQSLIQQNPTLINSVWANYELVGNVWTTANTVPPDPQAQRGALSCANTSMESFVQNGVVAVDNPYSCLSCHNMQGPSLGKTLPPVGLSHLFDSIQMPGGCDKGVLPDACTPYTTSR